MSNVSRPNILITGTPGTGKTTTAEQAANTIGFKYVNVGDIVKEQECHEGKDNDFDAFILDEDKLIDVLEPIMAQGGNIVDFHTCEIFPERWFDLVLVLRADTSVLFDRLKDRGYNEKKMTENMECEIMQVVLDAARESYDLSIVHELPSNTVEDMESNVDRIQLWYDNWKKNNNFDE